MNSNEIAKLAGVSRSTVSRVINNYPNVPEETRKKVLKVIDEYDYVYELREIQREYMPELDEKASVRRGRPKKE